MKPKVLTLKIIYDIRIKFSCGYYDPLLLAKIYDIDIDKINAIIANKTHRDADYAQWEKVVIPPIQWQQETQEIIVRGYKSGAFTTGINREIKRYLADKAMQYREHIEATIAERTTFTQAKMAI